MPESHALYENLDFTVAANSEEELWDGHHPLTVMELRLSQAFEQEKAGHLPGLKETNPESGEKGIRQPSGRPRPTGNRSRGHGQLPRD